MQKKRHFINGKSLVEVTYRKRSKPLQKSTEPQESGDMPDNRWGPENFGMIEPSRKNKITLSK